MSIEQELHIRDALDVDATHRLVARDHGVELAGPDVDPDPAQLDEREVGLRPDLSPYQERQSPPPAPGPPEIYLQAPDSFDMGPCPTTSPPTATRPAPALARPSASRS